MTAYVCHREDCPAYLMYLQSRGVDYEKDYCWTWQGRILDTGYGQGWCPCIKKNLLAHRLAYSLEDCGKIPEGLQIDHFCRNRSCINPQHMELVTSKENTLRGEGPTAVNAKREKCKRGHVYRIRSASEPGRKTRRYCPRCINIEKRGKG